MTKVPAAGRRVLIADDDPAIRALVQKILAQEGFEVVEAGSASQAQEMIGSKKPELVLVDVRLPDASGMDLLRQLGEAEADVGAILMTAYGSANTAIQAMQLGAFDYVTKPFEIDDVVLTIRRYFEYRDLKAEVEALRSDMVSRDPTERIVGNSATMQEVYKTIGRVAASDATVLIWGETGTGKELVANAMHHNSSRRNGPLIKVNCAALPESLLESELFGHEKGSFTGALMQRKGRFELANHGSIFLDEIGEMTLPTQRKLLRVLQEKEFERVGSSTPIKVEVRVIAATNKDLRQEVQERRFREDLYYRLNVISIELPPLRERKEDIPALVAHFCEKHRFTPGAKPSRVSDEAMQLLLQHDWPGNVRELENVIERAVVTAQGGAITAQQLTFTPAGEKRLVDVVQRIQDRVPFRQIVAEVERHALQQALDVAGGDRRRAADFLDMPIQELDLKLVELGIH
ncbi:MAG: sigma-54-dependent Fis family transcriptional regulator [Chloroflexota bacterium]|nr:sigma-54-dependent Fis family transcriptional regulator [Chloroflexota bacterium]